VKRVVQMLRAATLFFSLLALASSDAFSAAAIKKAPVPKEAQAIINKTRQAVGAKDFAKLRALMISEFTWSFGGDGDADQAIEAWRKDPQYMKQMSAVLKRGCHADDVDRVICPGKGGMGFRAAYVKTEAGWRMEYFVAGD
jgi:hypothetical protein